MNKLVKINNNQIVKVSKMIMTVKGTRSVGRQMQVPNGRPSGPRSWQWQGREIQPSKSFVGDN